MSDPNVEVEEAVDDLPYDPESDPEWDNLKWGKDNENDDGESSTEESDEADQPEADETEEPTETEAPKDNEVEDADQWLELKHLDDEPRKVTKEEAKALAQKGLDYDRIREERDSLKSSLPRYEEMEKFLKEMQGDFSTIEEFMDDTRARIKADEKNISYAEALAEVKAAKQPTPAQPASKQGDDINIEAFIAAYPDVKAEEIPATVWADVRSTGNLLESYKKYDDNKKSDRIAELEQEIETLKNNAKNYARSAGSSKSSGASSGKSLIASLWDDGD